MTKYLFTFICSLSLLFACSSLLKKDNSPNKSTSFGSISAKLNGANWSGAWCSSLIAAFGNTQVLTINGQVTEKVIDEVIVIGISSFTGMGTYTYGGATDKTSLSIKYKNKNYGLKKLSIGGGGGSGTIKITEFVKANGILNPGKAVGEFSGTILETTSNEVLTISNGKFNSVIVL